MSIKTQEMLNAPAQSNYIIRLGHSQITRADRERALADVCNNYYAFPSSLLNADFVSDDGNATLSDVQWGILLRGDESYGRNHGYYAVLDSVREVFERPTKSQPGSLARKILVDAESRPSDDELRDPQRGGFANGGYLQLSRPNFFIFPQIRSAEFLLFLALREVVGADAAGQTILSNGLSDTMEAHARDNGFEVLNIPCGCKETECSRFRGNICLKGLQKNLEALKGKVPIVVISLVNPRTPGFPVSMKNAREAAKIAREAGVPVVFDAERFNIAAMEILDNEPEYKGSSIAAITEELFTYCDAFVASAKRFANVGACLAFRDEGLFHKALSRPKKDIGVVIKEKQILNYGNDSYGALSGRDLLATALGFAKALDLAMIRSDAAQAKRLADLLVAAGVKGVVPAAYGVFLDMKQLFDGEEPAGRSAGFVIDLIRLFGVRAAEVFPDLVCLGLPRGSYNDDHIRYAAAAVAELYKHRARVPKAYPKPAEEDTKLPQYQAPFVVEYPPEGKL